MSHRASWGLEGSTLDFSRLESSAQSLYLSKVEMLRINFSRKARPDNYCTVLLLPTLNIEPDLRRVSEIDIFWQLSKCNDPLFEELNFLKKWLVKRFYFTISLLKNIAQTPNFLDSPKLFQNPLAM